MELIGRSQKERPFFCPPLRHGAAPRTGTCFAEAKGIGALHKFWIPAFAGMNSLTLA